MAEKSEVLKWSGRSGHQSKEEGWRRSKERGSRNLMDDKTQEGIMNEHRSLPSLQEEGTDSREMESGREPRVNGLC